jgi:DIM1 family U5 snRNP protein
MSYFLPHLPSGWHVDEAIKSEEDRVVVLRFGHDGDSQCMTMDETLYAVGEKVQNFAVIYLVDITQVPDFNKVSACNLALLTIGRDFGLDVRVVRPMHCDVLLSVGFRQDLSMQTLKRDPSNKHIMIDLGTGNNNKMYVDLHLYRDLRLTSAPL